jgi:hypothetical protein
MLLVTVVDRCSLPWPAALLHEAGLSRRFAAQAMKPRARASWLLPVPGIFTRRTTKHALAGHAFPLSETIKIDSPKGEFARGFGLWSL